MAEVVLEAIIQYDTVSEQRGGKERKRLKVKLGPETTLSTLKTEVIQSLGLFEEAQKRGMSKIDVILARIEKSSTVSKNFTFTTNEGLQPTHPP